LLGSLNASHASKNGLDHAAPGSVVGELATYSDAMAKYATDLAALNCLIAGGVECGGVPDPTCALQACIDAQTAVNQDIADASAALASAANKPITQEVVDAVNANLGIVVAEATEQQVADGASALQLANPFPHGLY
jgi:hypothetical protein